MLKKKLAKFRRKAFETIGSDRYSRPSLSEMDKKLEKYLTYSNGFFIEAGANDGFSQSNTYYLEKFRGWTGILIEGIPELYQQCVVERPKSRVFNCALVAADSTEPYITMKYANLMSIVEGALKSEAGDLVHLEKGNQIQKNIVPYEVDVPTKTLTSILDRCQVETIDLLSLDVEGFELNVLKGLDFERYQPKYMLIEARFKEEIESYISDLYIQVDRFSSHDYLYQLKNI
ncbi:MAG TPA: FkbM family methyltransferase [Coleofasciculaceae cyanobacterium]|jgi:FkbM family methyltransferase